MGYVLVINPFYRCEHLRLRDHIDGTQLVGTGAGIQCQVSSGLQSSCS